MVKGYKDFVDGKAKEWTGIKVIDDYTLQFDLDYPFSPFFKRSGIQYLCGRT